MHNPSGFYIFVNYIMAPLVLFLGLFGNIFGFFILLQKSLRKIGPVKAYMFLFLMDTFYLLQIVIDYLGHAYELNLTTLSNLSCKLYIYFNYSLAPVSPHLLVYILVERLISIKYPSKRYFLRSTQTQVVYLILVLLFNLLAYIPIALYYDVDHHLENQSETLKNVACAFTDHRAQLAMSWFDLTNRILVPFSTMVICSILVSSSIIKMRNRILVIFLHRQLSSVQKDVKFLTTSAFLNLVFILLNLPFAIVCFLPDYYYDLSFLFTFYLYYMSYGVNFYLIAVSNKLFLNEFLQIIRLKNKNITRIHDVIEEPIYERNQIEIVTIKDTYI